MLRILPVVALAAAMLMTPRAAGAQDIPPEEMPIGRYVADARVAFPKFKQDPNIASSIGSTTLNLPTRAFGFVVGAHWHPVRVGIMTLGLGGEITSARRGHTLNTGTKIAPVNVTVNSRFSAVSPQISFNFGARDGWSYISGGIGWARFTAERKDRPLPDQESSSKTINYGGGARWFAKKHLAVSMDLRFYAVNPQLATATRPSFPRMTLMAFSAGAAIR
jgi:outer membrane protein with beta-barrel domain